MSLAAQREAIKRLARQEGYLLTDDMIEEDHERGSKLTRKGYQRIIEHVREGRAATVIVYMFDRWGRDGAEWLTRAREFTWAASAEAHLASYARAAQSAPTR